MEKAVVVFRLYMVNLRPNTWDMDRVAMRRKPPVGFVYIGTDIANAVDYLGAVTCGLVQIGVAKAILIDTREKGIIAVEALRPKFVLDHRIHGIGHGAV